MSSAGKKKRKKKNEVPLRIQILKKQFAMDALKRAPTEAARKRIINEEVSKATATLVAAMERAMWDSPLIDAVLKEPSQYRFRQAFDMTLFVLSTP